MKVFKLGTFLNYLLVLCMEIKAEGFKINYHLVCIYKKYCISSKILVLHFILSSADVEHYIRAARAEITLFKYNRCLSVEVAWIASSQVQTHFLDKIFCTITNLNLTLKIILFA